MDGSDVEDLVTGLSAPDGIDLDLASGHVYWADRSADRIQRANLDGTGVVDILTGINDPTVLKLDLFNSKIYWTDPDLMVIRRSNLDGSGLEDVVSGLPEPIGLAFEPVPEPSSLVLLIVGISGFIGFAGLRRSGSNG